MTKNYFTKPLLKVLAVVSFMSIYFAAALALSILSTKLFDLIGGIPLGVSMGLWAFIGILVGVSKPFAYVISKLWAYVKS